ncbi:PQQ-binding-like beta-propeller repeat protein [Streptomyces sp. NPDC026092]|uniref:outer membrane protein assembly factor BamB family protein n=1 Tax=Streptomyces sp. NPDC026092 TaxID=3154797 RepID=UPI0033ED73C0
MYEDTAPADAWGPKWRLKALRPVWKTAEEDRPNDGASSTTLVEPVGGLLLRDAVIRADLDGLRAYEIRDGGGEAVDPRWTWTTPGRNVVAEVSWDVDAGLAYVLHHDDSQSGGGEPRIAAVDLAEGTRVSSHAYRGDSPSDAVHRALYGSAPTTVLSGRHVVSVTDAHVKSVDVRDRSKAWRTSLRVEVNTEDAWIANADPLTVVSTERGARGRRRLLVLDEQGKVTASPALPSRYERVEQPSTVVNDVLVATVDPDHSPSAHDEEWQTEKPDWIGGIDLSTGKILWKRSFHRLRGQCLVPYRGLLLVLDKFGTRVTVLDARDGRVVARRRLRGYGYGTLCVADDRFAVITHPTYSMPIRVFHWR